MFPRTRFNAALQVPRLIATAAMLCLVTQASSAAPPIPDSGSLLQQNQPPKPSMPANNSTGLKLEQPESSTLPQSAPFMINHIEISGNTLFDTAILHALVIDLEGQEHTLSQLNAAVDRLSEFYHTHGYPLSRAYVPAQTLNDGLVKVIVIEARYGEVHLNNASLVDNSLIESTLSALHGQDFVEQTTLDRTLLLLSDMPGVISGATLEPGQAVGTSDLTVETQPTAPYSATSSIDNNGNAATGRARINGTVNWIDPFHHADIFSASLTSAGHNMNSGSLSYETLVSGQGLRIGAMGTDLYYRLAGELAALKGHGRAQTDSLWLRYPWIRSVDVNLNSQFQLEYKNLQDDIDSTGLRTNRHLDVAELMLSGDTRSSVLAGAQTTFSTTLRFGLDKFDDSAAQALDQKSAQAEGSFVKFNAHINHLQNLTPDTAVYLALSAQWSNHNLDSSEKMVAGGAYSVRAYDMGALSGDTGALATLELRENLVDWLGGSWQAVAFTDNQAVRINRSPWVAGTNGAHLHGAGLGLNWANSTGWHFKVYAAAPTGSVPELLKVNKKVRAWAEIGAWF